MPWIRSSIKRCLRPVSVDGSNRKGLGYGVFAPIIEHGIYDIVPGICGRVRVIAVR
jgi:hypothetical protein